MPKNKFLELPGINEWCKSNTWLVSSSLDDVIKLHLGITTSSVSVSAECFLWWLVANKFHNTNKLSCVNSMVTYIGIG